MSAPVAEIQSVTTSSASGVVNYVNFPQPVITFEGIWQQNDVVFFKVLGQVGFHVVSAPTPDPTSVAIGTSNDINALVPQFAGVPTSNQIIAPLLNPGTVSANTGPDFPRPDPNNGIGKFAIGVSPIGTVPSFDFWSTVLAQYANSPAIYGVISSIFAALDMTENFDNFYDAYFDITTAFGDGLDNWGRILGVSRVLNVGTGIYFGFAQAVPGVTTFGFGALFAGAHNTTNFALSDPAYRILLMAKAAANISDGSIKSIDSILMALFPNRGNAYVQDNQDMTMSYVFTFPLTNVERAIVGTSGVLPKPAGVSVGIITP